MRDQIVVAGQTSDPATFPDKLALAVSRHWLLIFNVILGLFVVLPVLAPLLMAAGFTGAGQGLYRFFSFQCHQLPQRSYFLFGQGGGIHTYSIEQLATWGADPTSFNTLRAFIGNPEIGFKTALAHRQLALNTALLVGGLLWALVGRRLPRLSILGFALLILPMILDGGSHMLNEITRLGFRNSNAWAIWLTGGIFPSTFYVGTTFGTLNWLLRTVTGALFGLGAVWFLFPYLSEGLADTCAQLECKLRGVSVINNQESGI